MNPLQDMMGGFEAMSLMTAASRLGAAMLLGGIIGLNREVRDHPAGLRTHTLISLAAAAFAIIAMELTSIPADPATTLRADPLRLIESVTSGVAFLGAGSIVSHGGSVRGVTTGASMWLCGAIGLSCGVGELSLALLVTVLAMIVLVLLRLVVPEADKNHSPASRNGKG